MIKEATFLFDKSVHNFERDFGVRGAVSLEIPLNLW